MEPTTNESATQADANWPKHAVWLGLVITMAGAISYFLFFVQYPSLRDVPIVNLPIVMLGLALSSMGWLKMLKSRGGLMAKGLTTAGLLTSLGVAGLFNFYIFGMSYDLPMATGTPAIHDVAPNFTLTDHTDRSVSLSDFRGQKLVLVFYRGFW